MTSNFEKVDIPVVNWDDGPDHVVQAYVHPVNNGDQACLKVKRYTRYAYHNAAQSGAHQMIYDRILPYYFTRADVIDLLRQKGCPESKLPPPFPS
jgi:hypothetical protein